VPFGLFGLQNKFSKGKRNIYNKTRKLH
jgi:hypothetical protein